jgi:hypothetical protein
LRPDDTAPHAKYMECFVRYILYGIYYMVYGIYYMVYGRVIEARLITEDDG